MNFFKKIFGVSSEKREQTEEERKAEAEKNFDILKYDGVKAMKMQRHDYALECFSHALEIKDDLEIRDYMSQSLLALGKLTEAYEQLQKLADAQPDNINIFIRMAHVAYMMEDYVVMASVCEKALVIDKDSVSALYLYAKSCVGTADATNAVAMLTKAIILKPDYADAYLLRGEVLLGESRTDEADEDACHLLEEYADNEDVLMLKAKIEATKEDAHSAIDYLDKVIAANPFSADAYAMRGKMKRSVGDETGAAADEAQAAELAGETDAPAEDIQKSVDDAYRNVNPLGL